MTGRQSAPEREDATRHDHLEAIFVNVTGTEKLVEEQTQDASVSREIGVDGEGRSQTLSEYVSTMVRDDGLTETFAEPDTGPTPE
ncbi:hypothetical protein EGH21_09100 [Halomicroarcula sp. F13]|uniref:Uncharacterized protein n=1 Tax=Haloarcula rubra TaxID=2487747 RepID=A0AAW4PR78_9EURY|nr:hypothetical protein [Halomicroarcula rubra]MBX0323184.1 hypothetical protein [Halomicroarcula rubra]